jgi:hypothetical protein
MFQSECAQQMTDFNFGIARRLPFAKDRLMSGVRVGGHRRRRGLHPARGAVGGDAEIASLKRAVSVRDKLSRLPQDLTRTSVMTSSYAEAILLLALLCQVVPTVMASAPAAMARSGFVRIATHLAGIGLCVAALEYSAQGPLRGGLMALALLVPIQYWIFVLLERVFERRYHRAPIVSSLIRRFDMKMEDRFISLACGLSGLGLGIVAGLVIVALYRHPS